MEIERKLAEMGLELPNPPQPVANYVGAVQVGDLLFIGGVSNRWNGVLKYRGKVGAEISLEEAYDAARMCALNHLAVIKATLGDLDRVERVVKVVAHVNSAPGFNKQPLVANGESDLLVALYGERGKHTRLALGTAELNDDIPVETEIIVQVRPLPTQ
jgi:enamine deaminase RidA (YjgF/YER057c/UK114 family)